MSESGGDRAGLVSASEQAITAAGQHSIAPLRFARLERGLAWATEIPAAALVGVEILVLLIGVVSRYVFNSPLTWSDELASTLFLWLAMLGSVIALRRAEHMRLAFLVGLAPCALAALARDLRHHGGRGLPGHDDRAGARLCGAAVVDHHAGAGNPRRLPGGGDRGRRRAHAGDRGGAAGRARHPRRCRERACGRARDRDRVVAGAAVPRRDRQSQPGDLLRRHGGAVRRPGRADRLRLRDLHAILSGADDPGPAHHHGEPDRRRHLEPDPAVGAAVRLPRPADRDDGARPRAGRLHGGADRPCARRPVLCAARGDVPRLRHFRLQGRRHGRRRAGAVSGNAAARRDPGRAGRAARRIGRHVGDDPAEPGADHHRLGDGGLDRGTVHRRPAAGAGRGGRPRHRVPPTARAARASPASSARRRGRWRGPSWSRCPRWRCRSSSAPP